MFSIAKWIDTEYFPETKKAFFKERKNGEIAVCYRGRCWSYIASWCIFGRGDRHDLHKIFKINESSINKKFLQNAKKFIRSPESEQYLDDALKVFNRFRGFNFDYFANPAEFSDVLQLSNYFVNEPLPVKPEDERLEDYYNAEFTHALRAEKMRFENFLIDWESLRCISKTSKITPKDLIAYTSRICEHSSDWNEASKNLRPTVNYGLNGRISFQQSEVSEAIYCIAKALCYLKKEKASNHFSRIYIDSIFNLKRDATKTFELNNIINNFILLQGEESSTLEIISERISACAEALFMEPIPEHFLKLFSDTDSFFEKVEFLGMFFEKTYSFLGCIDQKMDILLKLRTKGDKLGKLVLDVHWLAPRTNQDYENTVIDFILKNYQEMELSVKFNIFSEFNYYYSSFKDITTLQLILTFFQNHPQQCHHIVSSIHWIADCLKDVKMSKNLLTNLNSTSFHRLLKHPSVKIQYIPFHKIYYPLFPASTLPFDYDWDQINKILISFDEYVGSFESFEGSKNCKPLMLKAGLADPFLMDFKDIAKMAIEVTNKKELSSLLYFIWSLGLGHPVFLNPSGFFQSSFLKTLVKNIKSINEVESHRALQALQQIRALLPFTQQKRIGPKSRISISNLFVRLAKVPNTYQLLTNKLIENVRSSYSSIEQSLAINFFLKNKIFEENLQVRIYNIKIWNKSKVLTLLEAMHFGAIFGPRLNEDVIFLILEIFIALQAHEALDNDQIAAKKKSESSELSTSESYSDTSSESSFSDT